MLSNGEELVWCSNCSKWTDHYTAGHPTSDTNNAGATPVGETDEGNDEVNDEEMAVGTFARLSSAGLI